METMTLFRRRLNRWQHQYGLAATEELLKRLQKLREDERYAKGNFGEIIKQKLIVGAARENISVEAFIERCFENQRMSDVVRYIDPIFAEKGAAVDRIEAMEFAGKLEELLTKKQMGMPLSVEERATALRIARLLLSHESGEPCRACVSEQREYPALSLPLIDFKICLEHIEEEINAPVAMTT